jgi:glycosyltransferase involved in cell wall biosynthesis
MVRFSVCIPNYNYGKYIGETIQSVLDQTYPYFEIIVIDNASTDNSWDVISKFVKIDGRINAYRNEYNIGFAPNLDRAAQRAKNEFIIMLSSDDTMSKNALEEYNNLLQKTFIDSTNILICSSVNLIDANSEIFGILDRKRFHNIQNEGKFNDLIKNELITKYNGTELFKDIFPRFSVPGPFNSTMFSIELYSRVGGYGSINLIGPDGHFSYKCLLEGADVIFIDKPLFNYRVYQGGQVNLVKKSKNINVLIDRYIFSNAYTDDQFEKINFKRIDFQKATLNTDCLNGALNQIREGNILYAFRHICFGIAAYPLLAIKNKKTYLLILLIILGPIGIFITRILFKFKNGFEKF